MKQNICIERHSQILFSEDMLGVMWRTNDVHRVIHKILLSLREDILGI